MANLFQTLPPQSFAALFCYKIRKDDRLQNMVSTRQAIAITKLLFATCFRKGSANLTPDDYIRNAVISTAPEDQEIARQVVMDILFPKLTINAPIIDESSFIDTKEQIISEIKTETAEINKSKDDISESILNNVANFLEEMAEDFGDLMTSPISENAEEHEQNDLLDFYFETLESARSNIQPFSSFLDGLGNPNEILLNQISSLDELTDFIDQKLLSSLNDIPPSLLHSIPHSNTMKNILEDSHSSIEQGIAQYTLDSDKFNQHIDNFDAESLAKIAKALFDSQTISMSKFQELAEKSSLKAEDISEMFNVLNTIQSLPVNAKEKFLNFATKDLPLVQSLEMAQTLENFPTVTDSLVHDLLDRILTNEDLEDKLSYQALSAIPIFNSDLKQAITNSLTKELKQLETLNDYSKNQELFNNVSSMKQQIKNPYYYSVIDQMRNEIAHAWMKAISAKQNFLNTGHNLVRQQISFDEDQIMEHGLKIGCFENEILEMLYTDYENFIKAIKKQTADIDGYRNMLNRLELTNNQLKNAIAEAFKSENKQAVGAFASENLQETSDLANASNRNDFLLSSLSAGPGEDLLKQWFIARDKLPSSLRNKMKKVLQNIIISTAMDMARLKLGSAESGLMMSNETRVYREGDEFDQIDIEGTLDNLIMKGKKFEQITPEDFITYNLSKGRVAILILLDVSGSMSGLTRLTYCAFLITMLVSRLREEEIAIAIFESNTHVIMEFGEDSPDIDTVIDELLEIKPMGGTVINSTLDWAYKQLQGIDEENLYFLVASDFELYYDIKNLESFKGIQKLKPKTYLIAPGTNISERELKIWEEAFGTESIKIQDEKQIIDVVCKIISNR